MWGFRVLILDRVCAWAVGFVALFLEFLGGLGDEEGSGVWGSEDTENWGFRVL